MTKKANPYLIHRAAELPRDAVNVKVAILREHSVYGARGTMMVGYRGKVYATGDSGYRASGDVRGQPKLFPAFSKLSGISQTILRKERKQWLSAEADDRKRRHVEDIARMAKSAGYRLVEVTK